MVLTAALRMVVDCDSLHRTLVACAFVVLDASDQEEDEYQRLVEFALAVVLVDAVVEFGCLDFVADSLAHYHLIKILSTCLFCLCAFSTAHPFEQFRAAYQYFPPSTIIPVSKQTTGIASEERSIPFVVQDR